MSMSENELALLDSVPDTVAGLREQLHRVVVGQDKTIDLLVAALLVGGHSLLIGVPGLAKTLLVRCLSQSLGWSFKRIQFTPDMMPSDVIGTEVLETDTTSGRRVMRFVPGPIFANLILADEINRTPPRTQAALLEAMAERQVTVAGESRALAPPFVVVATQNPIEQEGTYALPEAQLDRFMFSLRLDYPDVEQERRIVEQRLPDTPLDTSLEPIFAQGQAAAVAPLIGRMPVSEYVRDYAVSLARASRPDAEHAPSAIREYVAWGAGPRAAQYLALAGRALAVMAGAPTPSVEHIRQAAHAVLGHRIVLNYAATGDRVTTSDLVDDLLESVAV